MTKTLKKVCVVFIIKDGDKYLYLKREHTGAYDGYYMFPAGHVEDGESVLNAATRELREELGIATTADDFILRLVSPTPTHINFYFEVCRYTGTIRNNEPEKHSDCLFLEPTHPGIHPLCVAEINAIQSNQLFLSKDEA